MAPRKKAQAAAPAVASKAGPAATIERSELAAGLAAVARAVGSPTVVPALGDVLIRLDGSEATITATDLDVVMKTSVALSIEGRDGTMLAPAKLLSNVVTAVDGPISIELDGDNVIASSGDFVANLATRPVADFPQLTDVGGELTEIDASLFGLALGSALVAVSRDVARPVLTAILVDRSENDTLRLVATDSYRMIVVDVDGMDPLADGPILLPGKAAALMANIAIRNDLVAFRTDMQRVEMVGDTTTVIARLTEGQFPDYRRLLPSDKMPIVAVDRDALAKAVRRVRTLLDAERPLSLEFGLDSLTIRATGTNGNAHETIVCSYDGDPVTIAFSGAYLADAVNVIDSEAIEIMLGTAAKPSIFVGDSVRYLLMPVKV